MKTTTLAALAAALATAGGMLSAAPAAHADPPPPNPVRCKDVPAGAFGINHVCQFPDGSITGCLSVPLMVPPCSPIYTQPTPGFWNN